MPNDEGGILDFLFGRGALKKAAGTAPPAAPPPPPAQADPDFLRKQIALSTNKPPEPPPVAVKVLGAPRKKKTIK